MKEYINPHILANRIRLQRDDYQGTVILVEGRYDKLVYGNIFNIQEEYFHVSEGKENAIETIKILNQGNVKGILAIVDT